jgi:hypothetical protein
VQLVPDPAAGAARGERAAPHHQRRLRLLRYVLHLLSSSTSACQCATGRCLTHFTCRRVVAAREGQAGRQDGVDPAQLPGLRQVPHQGQPTTQRCFSISVTTVLLNSIMHVQCTRGTTTRANSKVHSAAIESNCLHSLSFFFWKKERKKSPTPQLISHTWLRKKWRFAASSFSHGWS